MKSFAKFTAIVAAATTLAAAGCASHKKSGTSANAGESDSITVIYDDVTKEMPQVISTATPLQRATMPKAVVYATNGNWNDNVAVTLNADRTALVSYPDPSDINADSAPLTVGSDGALLDRRGGIGRNTAFTRWTYAEYAALKQAPSPAEIMANIIPDARVVWSQKLPITTQEAERFTPALPSLIDEGAANRQYYGD